MPWPAIRGDSPDDRVRTTVVIPCFNNARRLNIDEFVEFAKSPGSGKSPVNPGTLGPPRHSQVGPPPNALADLRLC